MDEYQLERIILDNATRYEGKANIGSVMGTLLGVHPELKNIPYSLSMANA